MNSGEGTLVLFERKEPLPDDYSEGVAVTAVSYLGCPALPLTRRPSGLSCRDQREEELMQTERDKYAREIQSISSTVEGMVTQVAHLLQENSRLPERDR